MDKNSVITREASHLQMNDWNRRYLRERKKEMMQNLQMHCLERKCRRRRRNECVKQKKTDTEKQISKHFDRRGEKKYSQEFKGKKKTIYIHSAEKRKELEIRARIAKNKKFEYPD